MELINVVDKHYNLENELGFDHIGDRYEDLLKERVEGSSFSDYNNGYIINNNERTLLYTIQEELSEWKIKY